MANGHAETAVRERKQRLALPCKPVKMVRCENCKHALVGRMLRVRCEYGTWSDVPLDEMNWVVGQCRKFEAA